MMMTIEELNSLCAGTLMEHLNIVYTEIGEDYLCASMPVNKTTWQPMKILHGGATMALIESVGSALSLVLLEDSGYTVKGMEINANHILSVKDGLVYARARIIHKGTRSHVIEITVTNEQDKIVTVSRLTNMIVKV
jgi:1,4-dihydroxy-2-naphthoyl-CoA hydrolase